MKEADHQATTTDSLLTCCLCRRLLQDAVQLICLHNCCRQCFRTAALNDNSHDVTCGSCNTITQAGMQQPNVFIDNQAQRHKLVAESSICGNCKENGERDKPAVLWCPPCRQSLCEGCVPLHKQYFKQHVTQPLDELRELDAVVSQTSLSACVTHQMPMDIACLNCEQPKCTTCWAECNEKQHEMHVVGKDSFDSYIAEVVACITTMESKLLHKLQVLEKPKSVLVETKSAQDRHLEDLKTRKQGILDAVEMVYQEMELATKNAYGKLEAQCHAAAAAANRIDSELSEARSYIRRLVESSDKCEIFRQQRSVRERLSVLSAKIDTLSDRLITSMGEIKIEASIPNDFQKLIRAWIGTPHMYSGSSSHPTQPQQSEQGQQQQSLSFGIKSMSVQLPVTCNDVALTIGRRSLLLAAGWHGLLELCSSSGRELSYWLPIRHGARYDGMPSSFDEVSAVAALSKGRAAVFLTASQLVVLLRPRERGEGGSSGDEGLVAPGDAWTEELRVKLTWSAARLSGQGDVLAVWQSGGTLQLIGSSSGHCLSREFQCEPDIRSVTVAVRVLVIAHSGTVRARSLPYGEQLWCYELSRSNGGVLLPSVCSDSRGNYLYVAVCRNDGSTARVSVLSVADGSEVRRVELNFNSASDQQPLLQVVRLTLSENNAVAARQQRISPASISGCELLLTALCSDQTVVVHRSACGGL